MGKNTAPLPAWAETMAERYRGGTVSSFLLCGAVHDLFPLQGKDGLDYVSLNRYLGEAIFPARDAVIQYDQSSGITFSSPDVMGEFQRVAEAVYTAAGKNYGGGLPKDPRSALLLIERFIRAGIMQRRPKRVAVILDFASVMVPNESLAYMNADEQATLVTLLKWAKDPTFLAADVTICLVAENLSELNDQLVKNPFVAKIDIGLPTQDERVAFLAHLAGKDKVPTGKESLPLETVATLTAGLSRLNLMHLTSRARGSDQPLTAKYVNATKKELIEKECYGLLEFLEPKYDLGSVAGHEAAKAWLHDDIRLIARGAIDSLPMGYLFCGPVGTGKTFLATCVTGSIGIPCVRLLNFRSQWQGATEGNLEKIIRVLRAIGPVGVIIDEADAALGNREQRGDSGTQARVFSQLASQMGDTSYRGKLIWFLLTCRPDLIPVDLKRQGRCEVHIPLFYPESDEERRALVTALSRKVDAALKEESIVALGERKGLSGADIEGLLVRAKRRAAVDGRKRVRHEDLVEELAAFVPPRYGPEVEYQIKTAITECTDERFLPERYRKLDRGQLAHELQLLKGSF